MIEAKIEQSGTETITDWLGEGGTIRTQAWPAVDVAFIHTESGIVVATTRHTLRDGSAVQTLDDVTAAAQVEVDRLDGELAELEAAGADTETFAGTNYIQLVQLADDQTESA